LVVVAVVGQSGLRNKVVLAVRVVALLSFFADISN
jgi:hypothetical protein